MKEFIHYLVMAIILLGGVALLVLAIIWFIRGANLMGLGMLVMSLVAFSNYYLHGRSMKKYGDRR